MLFRWEGKVRKLIFLMLIATSVGAQTYSRWNYPYDAAKDAAVVAVIENALSHGYTTAPIRFPLTYTYALSDSNFEVQDVQSGITRVFRPTKGGATELVRSNKVIIFDKPKGGKLTKSESIGGDGILPKEQAIPEAPESIKQVAEVKAVLLQGKVEAICKDGKEWAVAATGAKLTDAQKRCAAWVVETDKKKVTDYIITAAGKGK
jgi:hypothetical protein